MRRVFPLCTAAGLGIALAGCAPLEADIDGVEGDARGSDDADGDPGDAPPDGDPGDDPDAPGDDPEATLEGAWALVSWDDELSGSYEGEFCTYTVSYGLAMVVLAGDQGDYDGEMIRDSEWEAEGDGCPYDGDVQPTTARLDLNAERLGGPGRGYTIRVTDMGLTLNCTMNRSDDDLVCDRDIAWAREG